MIENGLFDFVLIPAVAVDKKYHRLGYGGGFYDTFLASLNNTFTCATVFQCQIVNDVPQDVHDQTVQHVITDRIY